MAGKKDKYKNPSPTVDIIIELEGGGVVLIERKNPPHGWAIPGGFVDEGECVENAARREAMEETCLEVELEELLYVYSNPARDPRVHTMSTVFVATSKGTPIASDDAKDVGVFAIDDLPENLCFDHAEILEDYKQWRATGARPRPSRKLARYTESAE